MNINELAEKTIRHHVSKANGAGELVEYKHKDSGLIESVKCYPQTEIDEAITTEHISNTIVFRSLFLEEKPLKNDTISYDGVVWKIWNIKPCEGGYDITAYDKRHNLGVRR